MYCEKRYMLYSLMTLYIGSGVIFYNHIKPGNEYTNFYLLFLTFVYLSYAAVFFNILNNKNV